MTAGTASEGHEDEADLKVLAEARRESAELVGHPEIRRAELKKYVRKACNHFMQKTGGDRGYGKFVRQTFA